MAISIYPTDFDAKDRVVEYLDEYNKCMSDIKYLRKNWNKVKVEKLNQNHCHQKCNGTDLICNKSTKYL